MFIYTTMKITKIIILVFLLKISIATIRNQENRAAKFWPANIVRFRNEICQTLEGFDGICYRKRQCQDNNGISSGKCAAGLGVCCLFQGTCGGSSSNNNTYFTNPGFPNTYSNSGTCTFTVKKYHENICQIRLDFLDFNLAQPDGNGKCITDTMTISASASFINIPKICGENGNQHIYINLNKNINILISTSGAEAFTRSWNIKITQLPCDSPNLAPVGCLKYYSSVTGGTVTSFNYGSTVSGTFINTTNGIRPGTRQLITENYGICVQILTGYCSIEWSQNSFTVSGNSALAVVRPALDSDSLTGENCTTDFVVIANPSYGNGTAVGADRFCGNQFPTVFSSSKPFVLTVVTDGNEMTDIANRGFALNFRQIPCSANDTLYFVA